MTTGNPVLERDDTFANGMLGEVGNGPQPEFTHDVAPVDFNGTYRYVHLFCNAG